MAAEAGSDSQLRRRRRRDPEEPEQTERKEREPAVAVAMAQGNEEDDEERWVGPLPVEATLAKKRKGSGRDWHGAGGLAARPEWGRESQARRRWCICEVLCPRNRRSSSRFWSLGACACPRSNDSDAGQRLSDHVKYCPSPSCYVDANAYLCQGCLCSWHRSCSPCVQRPWEAGIHNSG